MRQKEPTIEERKANIDELINKYLKEIKKHCDNKYYDKALAIKVNLHLAIDMRKGLEKWLRLI